MKRFAALMALMIAAQCISASAASVVALGTSLTARGSWPDALARALSSCLGEQASVTKVAMPGAVSAWALTQIDHVTTLRPNVVLVELYANDASILRNVSLATSEANFGKVLDGLKAGLQDARFAMLVMSPVSGLRGAIRPRFRAYIEAHRRAAAARGVEVIDFTSEWSSLTPAELGRALPDGLHPAGNADARIMVPRLARWIGGSRCGNVGEP